MSRYERMMGYVPLYYHTSGIFKGLMQVEGEEFDLLRQNTKDLHDQFYVDTATWSLPLWEREYGLPVNPLNLSLNDRRAKIKVKIRGLGKADDDLIKSTAIAYSNGEVEVAFDNGIKITFIGTRGIPNAFEEMKRQLGEILPAHLPVSYEFTYLLWKEFDVLASDVQESMTWRELEVYRPFSPNTSGVTWDELDLLIPQVAESKTWDELEEYRP